MNRKYKKNSRGYYCTSVTLGGITEDGVPLKKYVYARTISELDKKVSAIREQLQHGTVAHNTEITFAAYSDLWLRTYKANRSVRTIEMYRSALKHCQRWDRTVLHKIRRSSVQILINEKAQTPRTAEQILLTLRQVFAAAVKDGIVPKTPIDSIDMPRHVKLERRALTGAEKKAVKSAKLSPILRAFVDILYGTGMRPAEMYALTWADVNTKDATININKSLGFIKSCTPTLQYPKTNSGIRTVYVPRWALKSIKALKRESCTLTLFGTESEPHRTKHGYAWMWTQIKREIERQLGHSTDITPYTFRHNYATELYYADVSLLEAQRLMGHSSHEMIMKVYSHLDQNREKTQDKINKIAF